MPNEDRRTALCEQEPKRVTGIDFVQVVEPDDQTLLRVFFLIDPDDLANPIDVGLPAEVSIVSVSGGKRLAEVPVVRAEYVKVTVDGGERTILEVETAEPGDFSIYKLTIFDEPERRIDRFFNGVDFSFKQGCPGLDCRPRKDCPEEPSVDFPVDYLARDFSSIRGALLDFAAQRYPDWTEKIEADEGVMLAEVMAALGDELSYIQDRYGREGHLETLSERRSLHWHTRLVDYPMHDGLSATALLAVMASTAGFVEAGMRVWAPRGSEPSVPFEIGERLRDQRSPKRRFWVHPDWNRVPVHIPDESEPCLQVGSTELFLRGHHPLSDHLPAPDPTPEEFWIGHQMVLESTPEDPSLPRRRHLVRIVELEQTEDPLCLEAGLPIEITRIRWQDDQALPFELCLRGAFAHANIVPATAGETFTETFAIGPSDALPSAVEREGPCNEISGRRTPTFIFSLKETESRGLGWVGELRKAKPEVELREVAPGAHWFYRRSILDAPSDADAFTLDDGSRRQVIGFRRDGEEFEHRDYASGDGLSIRFGDGDFGRIPADGTEFEVRYRTGPGTRANLPADTITLLSDPSPDPAYPWPTLAAIADSVTNPFPVTTGVDPEAPEVIKQLAPEAFKAEPLRAVLDEDYREIAERLLPWIQRAGATARWTGSWLTEFATADPLGSFSLGPERRAELENTLDCIRQVGREVYVRDPEFLDLDLEIKVCLAPSAYPGQVEERVTEALTGPDGFFHPDRFTFGTPLRRAPLEAAIQAVPGVRGVEDICLRIRGVREIGPFAEMELDAADDQIVRLQNDPRFPERGSLRVRTVTGPSCVEARA